MHPFPLPLWKNMLKCSRQDIVLLYKTAREDIFMSKLVKKTKITVNGRIPESSNYHLTHFAVCGKIY